MNDPTRNAPYTYWIESLAPRNIAPLCRVLRYRGSTRYGEGNKLAVIDSEMPEILRRLDLRRRGDVLPIPAN